MRRLRIALYSHDAMGMGHMRRNLMVADALARFPSHTHVLLIAGARELNAFGVPPGVDSLTLPGLRKNSSGAYETRSLNIPLRQLIALRTETIRSALRAFDPDVFIVDKVPRGVLNELDSSLRFLRAQGRTRCILGMRDVLDAPEAVRREWAQIAAEDAIRRYYDAVWVYGDPAVYNPIREYGLSPEVGELVRFTGYLDPKAFEEGRERDDSADPVGALPGPLALCQLGGGQDGCRLAESVARATLPRGTTGVILTGPFLPDDKRTRLEERSAGRSDLRLIHFTDVPGMLVNRAERVIAMGGYNTVCQILAYGKRALIVPRVSPRREQFIRAKRFSELGLVDMLHPDEASPLALTRWLAEPRPALPSVRERIDFDGLARVPGLVDDVMSRPPRRGAELRGRNARPA